jgi:hypothetical protein
MARNHPITSLRVAYCESVEVDASTLIGSNAPMQKFPGPKLFENSDDSGGWTLVGDNDYACRWQSW